MTKMKWKRTAGLCMALLTAVAMTLFLFPKGARAAADVPTAQYSSIAAAINAGETDIVYTGSVLAEGVSYGGTTTVQLTLSADPVIVTSPVSGNIHLSAGTVCIAWNGSVSGCTAGVSAGDMLYLFTKPGAVSGDIASIDGSAVSYDAAYGGYWLGTQTPSTIVTSSGIVYRSSGGSWSEVSYSITYLDASGKTMSLSPSSYCQSTGATLPQPEGTDGSKFDCWYDVSTQQRYTKSLPAGFSGDVTLQGFWKAANEAQGGGAAGGAGGTMASGGGGGGSAAVASTADTADTEETAGTTAATGATESTGSGGGMRVQVANSSVKANIVNTGASQTLMSLEQEGQTEKKEFPWAVAGIGILLAGGLTGLALLAKKRSDERMAAICEKLHIDA